MRSFVVLIFLASVSSGLCQPLNIASPVKFLALGDSYTIGQSVAVADRWPVQLVDSLRSRGLVCDDAKIIAQTGWRTDNLSDVINLEKPKHEYSLVGLLIGVNDYYQGVSVDQYTPRFTALLDTAIMLAKGDPAHVFVISIPDYGYTPFGQHDQATITKGIDSFNAANRAITAGKLVPYFYITDISRRGLDQPDLVTTDGLHPSGKQYTLWVAEVLKGATLTPDTTGTITGIEQLPDISVYPIPFNEKINIEIPDIKSQAITFRLIDMMGKVVFEVSESTREVQRCLPTTGVSVGFYIFEIVCEGKIIAKGKIFK